MGIHAASKRIVLVGDTGEGGEGGSSVLSSARYSASLQQRDT